MSMWIDAHCHLHEVSDVERELEECRRQRVSKIVCVPARLEEFERATNLKNVHNDNVLLALGLHPQYFSEFSDEYTDKSIDYIFQHAPMVSMIGEVGLDFKYATDKEQQTRQEFILQKQVSVARQLGIPLNLHSRRAARETLNAAIQYKRETGNNSILHWFTHSGKLAKQAGKNGIYISVGPAVIHDENIQRIVKDCINPNFLLLESDAPVEYEGLGIGLPSMIPQVGNVVSKFLGVSDNHLCELVERNFNTMLTENKKS
eukprot:TRINITY_DN8404_c0_g1_i1.p1 TRINITY_DN8404_c0_g1~~TRINITY_DN8404_c0_g1_i1.p1  ORF type:complete len:260 (+),score=42.81 TRINITY_DN8404_c0_g1_i1:427-1206(+)